MSHTKIDLYVISSKSTQARAARMDALVQLLKGRFDVWVRSVTEPEPESMSRADVLAKVLIEKVNNSTYDARLRNLQACHVSNALKHAEALRLVSESTRIGSLPIVLEDDAVAGGGVCDSLASLIQQMDARVECQFVALGLGGGAAGLHRVPEEHKVLPVCNAYAVRPALAARLASSFLPLRYVTNVHLSYLADLFGVPVFAWSPGVFLDGSKTGADVSTLSPTNELIFNADYVRAKKLLEERGADAAREVIAIVEASGLAGHPDFMHLRARAVRHAEGAEAARRVYEEALLAYDARSGLVNNESRFLIDYVELFAELQEGQTKANAPMSDPNEKGTGSSGPQGARAPLAPPA